MGLEQALQSAAASSPRLGPRARADSPPGRPGGRRLPHPKTEAKFSTGCARSSVPGGPDSSAWTPRAARQVRFGSAPRRGIRRESVASATAFLQPGCIPSGQLQVNSRSSLYVQFPPLT
uniref:Uncharacterized protein n=1 Tax=Oryza meridionalis TaxID=40149 RepID=A0A0E0BWT7_9ORYZ